MIANRLILPMTAAAILLFAGCDEAAQPSTDPTSTTEQDGANKDKADKSGGETPTPTPVPSGDDSDDGDDGTSTDSGTDTNTGTGTDTGTDTGTGTGGSTDQASIDVSSVSPVRGPASGGRSITITGTGFASGATVKVGALDCTSPAVSSSTAITCTIPAASVGTYNVAVTQGGQTKTLTQAFTYYAVLAITPTTKTLAVNNQATFSASGGHGTLAYSASSGSITQLGAYTAPASAGSATITVQDDDGNSASATVTVNSALAISPTSKTLAVNNQAAFSASGGVGPFTYSVTSGSGSFSGSTYTAPGSSGSATVAVTDSLGNTSSASVTINPALAISPSSKTLAVNNSVTFSASGGVGSYTYTADNGSITSAGGVFTAPSSSGSATVTVTDSLSNQASAAVTINPALAISPTTKEMLVSSSFAFSASGGSTPYTYSVSSGSGSFSGATYTAPASIGLATVTATDDLGNTSNSNITIYSVGSLDYGFGSSGLASSVSARAVKVHSNGKIYVAGKSSSSFILKRYLSNGSLDTSYGTSGSVTNNAEGYSTDGAYAVHVNSDGSAIAMSSGYQRFLAIKFDVSGAVDTGFGSNGYANNLKPCTSGVESFGDSLVTSGGKVILFGMGECSDAKQKFILMQLNSSGSLDTGFGTSGSTVTQIGTNAYVTPGSLALQSDGKIIVVGGANGRFIVARYTTAGALDTTFGSSGITQTDVFTQAVSSAHSLAVLSNDKILVSGKVNNTAAIVRYTASGGVDTTFGTSGTASVATGLSLGITRIALQADGKILLAAFDDSSASSKVWRYNADGTLDTAFGTSGVITSTIRRLSSDFGSSIAIDGSKFLIVGDKLGRFFSN